METFADAVYRVVRLVPEGRIVSYGGVAALLGRPRAARGVGRALSELPADTDVPWWRVVNRDGRISLPGGAKSDDRRHTNRSSSGPGAVQRALLEREGVVLNADGRARWEDAGWQPDDRALKAIRRLGKGVG